MSTEKATDGSRWQRRTALYIVRVEHSAPHGVTTYRREVPTANGQRRLCTMKTERFVKAFTKVGR